MKWGARGGCARLQNVGAVLRVEALKLLKRARLNPLEKFDWLHPECRERPHHDRQVLRLEAADLEVFCDLRQHRLEQNRRELGHRTARPKDVCDRARVALGYALHRPVEQLQVTRVSQDGVTFSTLELCQAR